MTARTPKHYCIRYNHLHKEDPTVAKWKVYSQDGEEQYLAEWVDIRVSAWTEDTMTEHGVKYSLVAFGLAHSVDYGIDLGTGRRRIGVIIGD